MALSLACGFVHEAAAAATRDLTVAIVESGDAPSLIGALKDISFAPFSATANLPVALIAWQGGLDELRSHAADWDAVAMPSVEAARACEAGILDKLDWTVLGGRDRFLAAGTGDCAVGGLATATVLGWDREKFSATPSWSDFWDVAKFPGKRGLRRSVENSLEIALLADGVAPGDVYRTLRGGDGVARAFRKLDQLKPYLVFWRTGAEAVKLLGSGEVLMTSAPAPLLVAAIRDDRRSFAMQWAGNLVAIVSWGVVKGSPFTAAAMKLVAALVDPKSEIRIFAATGVGGLTRGANDGLAPEQAATSPTSPANLDRAVIYDEAFWRENRERLAAQFEAWLAH